MLVIHNTFLNVVEVATPVMKRASSDSNISSSSIASWSNDDSTHAGSVTPDSMTPTLQPVPETPSVLVNPLVAYPSLGSQKHAMGECKPCPWFQRKKCMVGNGCPLCHSKHGPPIRPGKRARDRQKAREAQARVRDQEWPIEQALVDFGRPRSCLLSSRHEVACDLLDSSLQAGY